MATKSPRFTETLPRQQVKESDTGHAQDAAKKAPLAAKDSVLLGGEQTSDGLAAEKRELDLHAESQKKKEKKKLEAGIPKKMNASLKPIESGPPSKRS